jgi:hypothetical protein
MYFFTIERNSLMPGSVAKAGLAGSLKKAAVIAPFVRLFVPPSEASDITVVEAATAFT